MSVVVLADVKAHLNITSTSHDGELQDTVDRAEAVLAKRVGPLAAATVTDEVHTGPGPLLLRKYPVLSVTSATSDGIAVTDLDLDPDAGVLHGTFTSARRKVKVTYTAGRASLPADLEAAVLELTKHLWESQRGTGQALPGALPGEDVQPGSSYLLPYRVQSLIEPYVLPTVG